jgi:glycerol-3-phosphate acyltransferase PlsY
MLAGYLAGSIPTGYWLVRVVKHEDIRRSGSGNIGATNVWRSYGRSLGVPVIVVDVLKGFLPALLASQLVGVRAGVLAGAAAMLGHWRPLFMGWQKGGKMVATAGGVFLGLAPLVALLAALAWLAVFLLLRYASLASLAAAFALPTLSAVLGQPWEITALAAAAGAGVVFLHRANIKRLRAGTESRFSFRRRAPAA